LIPIPEGADQLLMEWETFKGRPVSIAEMRERLLKAGQSPALLEHWINALEGWVKASGLSGNDAKFVHDGFERNGTRAKVIVFSSRLMRRAVECIDATF
jgi:hypothetical protein